MTKHRLPIGIQTFRTLRERNCYYVDKTGYIERLLDEGHALLPVAPPAVRQEPVPGHAEGAVRGQRGAVRGAPHPRRPMTGRVHHPVVRLDFAGGSFKETALLEAKRHGAARRPPSGRTGVVSRIPDGPPAGSPICSKRCTDRRDRQVVVLVDEYDKPILGRDGGSHRSPAPTGISWAACME